MKMSKDDRPYDELPTTTAKEAVCKILRPKMP